ncbi:MAG TPA: tetratricopeptide repeat protein [Pyrinomonadaceae bacterium]|nr:tetratricopeptide repeat protein [Pyrinomonadaceae bacterium]
MSFLSAPQSKLPTCAYLRLLTFLLIVVWPAAALAQGSGRSTQGTNGNHVITGYVFFPSGRRAEGTIQVKLQSLNSGELSVIADSSGSFMFSSLSPGNYTVVVIAGDEYEIGREAVFIDTDLDLSRMNVPVIKTSRRYTVMVTLQLKHHSANHSKGSVVNAALAEVPENARTLYEKSLELARAGDSLKAIDNLKAAISLFPKFPLALNELGVQYLKVNQPHKAIDPLRSATKLSPDAFLPKLNLGVALLETNRFAEAETQLRECLKQNDSAPTAHMYLGIALTKSRNYVDAENELRRAIELGGGQLGLAHKFLGGIYWGRREYRLAADELETYLRLTPNAQDAERVRGTIMELRSALTKPGS